MVSNIQENQTAPSLDRSLMRKGRLRLCQVFLALFAATSVQAQLVVLDSGHMDLVFNFSGGQWQVAIEHDDFPDPFTNLSSVVMFGEDALPEDSPHGIKVASRPPGSGWDFLGVSAEQPFYSMPRLALDDPLDPGWNAESTTTSDLLLYSEGDPRAGSISGSAQRWITITLESVRYTGEGDGYVSLWAGGPPASNQLYFSTYQESIDPSFESKYFLIAGGHQHASWGFSDPGFYEVDLRASAFLADGTPTQSEIYTFQFGIGVIPEPSGLMLAALALAALMGWRRRR